MCLPKIVFWYFGLLLLTSSSKSQENSTNDDEQSDNSIVQYDLKGEMELIQCNSSENSIKNDDKMEYESSINSTKDDDKNEDSVQYKSCQHMKDHEQNNQTSVESHANSTEINDFIIQEINKNFTIENESDSISNEPYGNFSTDNYNNTKIVPFEACGNVTCIQLCCPFGEKFDEELSVQRKCVAGQNNYSFPSVFGYENEDKKLNELFWLTIRDPCVLQGHGHYTLYSNKSLFFTNGSLSYSNPDLLYPPAFYCLAVVSQNIYDVIVCTRINYVDNFLIFLRECDIVSLPFLLLTFVVYSILPQLQNIRGYILRSHVASLFFMYMLIYMSQRISGLADWKSCILLAYILYFSGLSTFFWLNITCFDIWLTFREFQSNQTKLKQDKKFMIYSLYAWGIPFMLSIICLIMDIPGIPESLIRPEMCKTRFWFGEEQARMVYFNIPMGITIIGNICFFIAIMRMNLYQKKTRRQTTNQINDSEIKHQNLNKQRLSMYLKLFIVMGLSWIMQLIGSFNSMLQLPMVIFYPFLMINALQGLIIFIIFVCTRRNAQLLLKRFGEWYRSLFRKTSRDNDDMANTMVSVTLAMQEIRSPNS